MKTETVVVAVELRPGVEFEAEVCESGGRLWLASAQSYLPDFDADLLVRLVRSGATTGTLNGFPWRLVQPE